MKKIFAIITVIALLFTLTACGGEDSADASGYIMRGNTSTEEPVELGTPETKLNPADVYKNLTYTPQMFYGDYAIEGGEEAEKKFGQEKSYVAFEDSYGNSSITKLPFRMVSGPNNITHSVSFIEGYDWMTVYYMRKNEGATEANLATFNAAYTVKGNTLTIKPIKDFERNDETKKITYSFYDTEFKYEFAFDGTGLKLTQDGESVTLKNGRYNGKPYFSAEAYLSKGSAPAGGVDQFSFLYEDDSDYKRFFVESISGESVYTATAKLEDNGLFTFTVPWEKGTKTYQYVYFYGYKDGLVLTDGKNVYYYNDNYTSRNTNSLNEYLSEDQSGKLEALSESELKAIVEKKEDLTEDLIAAFEKEGIKVSANKKTGELAMDSSVLFGGDSAVLTADGKTLLDKFVKAYTSIVFSEKYKDFVAKTVVEGHTAPISGSTYESGLPLSKERAKVVKNYCVSLKDGKSLAKALEDKGCSNTTPIYNADGEIDLDACRRVCFKFVVNIG